jgi:hypothetical protein
VSAARREIERYPTETRTVPDVIFRRGDPLCFYGRYAGREQNLPEVAALFRVSGRDHILDLSRTTLKY